MQMIASGVLTFAGFSFGLDCGLSTACGQAMLVIGIAGLLLSAHHARSIFEVRSVLKSQASIPSGEQLFLSSHHLVSAVKLEHRLR